MLAVGHTWRIFDDSFMVLLCLEIIMVWDTNWTDNTLLLQTTRICLGPETLILFFWQIVLGDILSLRNIICVNKIYKFIRKIRYNNIWLNNINLKEKINNHVTKLQTIISTYIDKLTKFVYMHKFIFLVSSIVFSWYHMIQTL